MRSHWHCVYNLTYHLVLVTKYRKECITKTMLKRLEEVFSDTMKKWKVKLLEFNGEPDHVHLLIELDPTIQPSKLINNLKTVSSRYIRKEFSSHLKKYFWKPVFWTRAYCLLTTGGAPIDIIRQYIEKQGEDKTNSSPPKLDYL